MTSDAVQLIDGQQDVADPCARCGYDLRGIADDAACPECGLLAERSRQRSDALHEATPRWLAGISLGMALILMAQGLALVWPVAIPWCVPWVRSVDWGPGGLILNYGGGAPRSWIVGVVALNAGFDAAAIVLVIGMWLATRAQGRPASDAADRRRRVALRLLACGPLLVLAYGQLLPAILLAFSASRFYGYGYLFRFAFWINLLGLALPGAVMFPLMFMQLRGLARRVLHPRLAEHATIAGIGGSATLIAMPLVYGVIESHADRAAWIGRSWVPLTLMTLLGTAFLLFAGWSVLNCIRFILAFHKAYRGAKRKWAAADRAAT